MGKSVVGGSVEDLSVVQVSVVGGSVFGCRESVDQFKTCRWIGGRLWVAVGLSVVGGFVIR